MWIRTILGLIMKFQGIDIENLLKGPRMFPTQLWWD